MITHINPPQLSPKSSRSSHVVRAGDWLFIAGQIADDAQAQPVGLNDPEAQGKRAYQNLATALAAAGATPAQLVAMTIYVTDRANLPAFRLGREQYLPEGAPATTVIEVKGLFRPEYLIEVQAVAYLGK